jgi:hypothetical protein
LNAEKIRARIERVAISEADLSIAMARDVAFHLTDWLDDLNAFVMFCHDPDAHTPEQIDAMLLALLQHAPNHVAAAAKLYADFPVSDIFGVGAVAASTDGHA